MNSINLIPARRLSQRRRQHALRLWLLVDGIYLVVLIAAGAFYAFYTSQSSDGGKAAVTKAELVKSNGDLTVLHGQLIGLKANLQSIQEVANGADWSILLAVLSNSLGDEVVLNSVDCIIGKDAPSVAPVSVPQSIKISGIARSQRSVTQYVLRLEQMQFFDRIRLLRTAPQTLRGHSAIGFELECTLPMCTGGNK